MSNSSPHRGQFSERRLTVRVALTEAARELVDAVVTAHTDSETRLLRVLLGSLEQE
ncbi:hypothetical protein [Nocardia sp. NPDC051570]|uniref:hypothetical protein n=1 Tax=Nocardia sp. NPDC051570 TaxID=3364324 RepID=UPI0037A14680